MRSKRKKIKTRVLQSENDSNNEDCAHSPILLDLDKNSKQQEQEQRQRLLNRKDSSPSKLLAANQYLQDELMKDGSGTFNNKKIFIVAVYRKKNRKRNFSFIQDTPYVAEIVSYFMDR